MPKRRQKGSKSAKKSTRPSPDIPGPPTPSTVKPTAQRAAALPRKPAGRSTSWRGLPIWLLAVLAALVVVIIAVAAYFLLRPGSRAAGPQSASAASISEVKMPDEGAGHVAEGSPITYRNNPPSSGKHYPEAKPWGVYDEPLVPGYFVHNLEHGGVVVLYDCKTACPDLVNQLKEAQQSFPKGKYGEVKLVVTPYSGLPEGVQVTALAWDYQIDFRNGYNRDQLLAFYRAHVDRGPEDVP